MKKVTLKKGILSSIIISIISVINLVSFLVILLPFDAEELVENNKQKEEVEAMALMFLGIVVGAAILLLYVWIIAIALTHIICLIFTIKNRKSDSKGIRLCNYVLDVVNLFLIIAPLVKFFMALNWEVIIHI